MKKSRLIALLQQMLDTDFAGVRAIIEATFAEFEDPALDALLQSIVHETPDERLREAVEWHGRLICACRDLGVEAGFALMQAEQKAALLDAIGTEMARPPAWSKLRATLEAYGEDVLTENFDRVLGAMISNLQSHRRFLEECRSLGTDVAFRRHGVGGPHIQINLATLPATAAALLERLGGMPSEFDGSSVNQIELLRLILGEIEPTEHAELWGALQDRFGNQLCRAARQQPTEETLHEAIQAFDRALEVRDEHRAPNAFASTQNNRGIALQSLAELAAGPEVFDQALQAFEAAARVWTLEDYPHDRAIVLNNLGDGLRALGDYERRPEPYLRALEVLQEALVCCDPVLFPADRVMIHRNLGAVRLRLGELGHDPQDLVAAIDILSSVVSAVVPSEPLLQMARKDLANAKRLRGEREGDVRSLREAVGILRGVVEALANPAQVAIQADAQADLAAALLKLGELEAGDSALTEAVVIARTAIETQLQARDPRPVLATRNTLGVALRTLGLREARIDLLKDAADVFRDIRHFANPKTMVALWTSAAINLAATLQSQGEIEQSPAPYREAAVVAETAMSSALRADRPLDWATLANEMGDALFGLGMLTSDPALLTQAASAYGLSLEERTEMRTPTARAVTQNNLGNALRVHGELCDDAASAAAAVKAYRAALGRWTADGDAAVEWARTTKSLGLALSALGQFDEAAIALGELMDNLLPAIWSASNLEEQRRFLQQAAGAGDELAYSLVQLGRLPEALDAIDRGRAIGLHHALDFADDREIQTARHHWKTCCEVARRAAAVAVAVVSPSHEAEQASAQAVEIGSLRAAAREAHATLTALLASRASPPALEQPGRWDVSIPAGGALAVLVSAKAGGSALVLYRGSQGEVQIKEKRLDALSSRAVDEFLSGSPETGPGWLRRYADLYTAAETKGAEFALRGWNDAIGGMLERLWTTAMGPLDRLLREIELLPPSEVVLVVPGRMSILPLHAARRPIKGDWRYFMEDWPTTLSTGPRSAGESRLRAVRRTSGSPSLLAVTDPLGDLGISENPAWSLFADCPRERLDGPAATVEAVCAGAVGRSILSFFCHGDWDPGEPENSALVMAGSERLTIRRLRQLDLGACRMAILAACETGVAGVHELPDEFVALPTALAEAGVPGVLSTLWPVEAGTTFRVITQFLAAQRDGQTPAWAMREAQLALLNALVPAPVGDMALQGAGSPAGVSPARSLTGAEPALWAAFVYTGA